MNILITIYNEVLYKPLLNALFLLHQYVPGHDIGIAVILLTIIIRFIFYPLSLQAIKSQKKMNELQPKLKEIQAKYKDDKEEQTKAMMAFYKENKFNPFSGCLPTIVQLPFLIALYQVFLNSINASALSKLYSFVPHQETINMMFLGLIDLSQKSLILAVLAGAAQFFQAKTMTPITKKQSSGGRPDMMQMMNKQMIYIFPLITFGFCYSLPSAVALYWITTSVFSIVQQMIIFKKNNENQYEQARSGKN